MKQPEPTEHRPVPFYFQFHFLIWYLKPCANSSCYRLSFCCQFLGFGFFFQGHSLLMCSSLCLYSAPCFSEGVWFESCGTNHRINDTDFQSNSPCFGCTFLLLHSWARVGKVQGLWRLLQHGSIRRIVNNDFVTALLRLYSNQLQSNKSVLLNPLFINLFPSMDDGYFLFSQLSYWNTLLNLYRYWLQWDFLHTHTQFLLAYIMIAVVTEL